MRAQANTAPPGGEEVVYMSQPDPLPGATPPYGPTVQASYPPPLSATDALAVAREYWVLIAALTVLLVLGIVGISIIVVKSTAGIHTAPPLPPAPPHHSTGGKAVPITGGGGRRSGTRTEQPLSEHDDGDEVLDEHYVFYYTTGTRVLSSSPYAAMGPRDVTPRMFDLPLTRHDLEPRQIVGYACCCHTDRLAICNHMDLSSLEGYSMEMLLSYEDRRVHTPGWKLILALGSKFVDPECHLTLFRDTNDHAQEYERAGALAESEGAGGAGGGGGGEPIAAHSKSASGSE